MGGETTSECDDDERGKCGEGPEDWTPRKCGAYADDGFAGGKAVGWLLLLSSEGNVLDVPEDGIVVSKEEDGGVVAPPQPSPVGREKGGEGREGMEGRESKEGIERGEGRESREKWNSEIL